VQAMKVQDIRQSTRYRLSEYYTIWEKFTEIFKEFLGEKFFHFNALQNHVNNDKITWLFKWFS